ncbi:uncharacterized protein [Eurosta solidaginis]|uniref:uncharacterized protein n=1 Tax=Eurosta solidaginis TaxID=178769 RepID=UPI0035305BD6
MAKLTSVLALLVCVAITLAEPGPGDQLQRQLRSGAVVALRNQPYLFLTVPRVNGNGHAIQGFKVVGSDDDDEVDEKSPVNSANDENEADASDDDDNDDEEMQRDDEDVSNDDNAEHENDDDNNDDDDENIENDVTNNLMYLRSRIPNTPRVRSQLTNQVSTMAMIKKNRVSQLNAQLVLKNAKPTNMMVSRENAGAIMVPDGFIEIEGQTVVDEKTGKTSLLVPRNVLDAIPEGSVVALVDGSAQDLEEARANRVIVRRRRKGSRRNVVRRGGGGNRGNRRRQGGGQRRRVQVYRIGVVNNGRRRRVRRPVLWQG